MKLARDKVLLVAENQRLRTALFNLTLKLTAGGGIHGNPYCSAVVGDAIEVLTDGKSRYDLPVYKEVDA